MKSSFIAVIATILIVLTIIVVGNSNGPRLLNKETNLITDQKADANINVYNLKNNYMSISGWETYLNEERVLGTENYKQIVTIDEKDYAIQRLEDKIVLSSNLEETSIGIFHRETANKIVEESKIYWQDDERSIGYLFTKPKKNMPYFKIQIFAEPDFELNTSGYGLIIRGYNVLLPNGTRLINDYNRTELEENKDLIIDGKTQNINEFESLKSNKIILNGTNYKNNVSYQIFYNDKDAIIIFSNEEFEIDNLFKWQVFRPRITRNDGKMFDPLYIVFIKDAELYHDGTWIIISEQYNGKVDDYIEMIKNELQ